MAKKQEATIESTSNADFVTGVLGSAGIEAEVAPVAGGVSITINGWACKVHSEEVTEELVLAAIARRPANVAE